jgi:hypothetical protein
MTGHATPSPIPGRRLQDLVRGLALCAALAGTLCVQVWAQDAVWLCGQTLTNQPPVDESLRPSCRLVHLSNATTVPGQGSRTGAPGQGAASPSVGRDRTAQVQVSADEQRARDGQARALLLAEKQRVQAQLQSARRVGDAAQVALGEADLASIDRELSRLP